MVKMAQSLRQGAGQVNVKRVLVLSAYHAQSHQYWVESLCRELKGFDWQVVSLPARFFAWRIRGNPLSFLAEFTDVLQQDYDLGIATSMVDLATLKGICPQLSRLPWLVYFHENQFAYPASGYQHPSLEPQMVNLYAALAADKVVFNSDYNRRTFLAGVTALMQKMPDCKPDNLAAQIGAKTSVLSVPVYLPNAVEKALGDIPKLLWNHRWEYDKGPDLLLAFLKRLELSGERYRLAIVGQQFRQQPAAFAEIKKLLDNSKNLTLEEWGYQPSTEAYQACLASSDIVLSTAEHDFQGLAVLEAVAAGARPVVPDALAYPEWFSSDYCYAATGELHQQAEAMYQCLVRVKDLTSPNLTFLSWPRLAVEYQQLLQSL